MNRVILSGFISTDIEFGNTNGGISFTRFNLGVKKMKEGVDFIPIVAWNQVAENTAQFCEKGSKILVEGRMQTGSYEKDGQKRYTTDVVADRIEFLDRKKDENQFKDMSIKTSFDTDNQIQIQESDLPF